ncbi:MAG: amino acid ABC transporter substrate-binding protein, partial [Boseongicola sp. SB0675_bin_26]|nr:amino acid ABC transporter substrate-binding protein [Boseongicola sp. SB0675_bin_26]
MQKSVFYGALAAAVVLGGAAGAATLDDVKARGNLNCGVSTGLV